MLNKTLTFGLLFTCLLRLDSMCCTHYHRAVSLCEREDIQKQAQQMGAEAEVHINAYTQKIKDPNLPRKKIKMVRAKRSRQRCLKETTELIGSLLENKKLPTTENLQILQINRSLSDELETLVMNTVRFLYNQRDTDRALHNEITQMFPEIQQKDD